MKVSFWSVHLLFTGLVFASCVEDPILQKANLFQHGITIQSDSHFIESGGILSNYACRFRCPDYIIQPVSIEEIQNAMDIRNEFNLTVSIRGGGHGYTCQASKVGGLLINMRHMNAIKLQQSDLLESSAHLIVQTGATWGQVLSYLNEVKRKTGLDYVTVHGQCTSVGVAGFSLHGGVHFGGWSELFGLSSDNIVALTLVLANGSAVSMSDQQCLIDSNQVISSSAVDECKKLWIASRGAGSNFGVVTSISFKLHRRLDVKSALTILSVNTHDPVNAEKAISAYFELVPTSVSLTLYGLDAYFKASKYLHFVVEASWVESNFNSGQFDDTSYISVWDELERAHTSMKHLLMPTDSSTSACSSDNSFILRQWIRSGSLWSVTSYDLVWGGNHAYGAASIITDKPHSSIILQDVVNSARIQTTADKMCSDCVTVVHRVGDVLRNSQRRQRLTLTETNVMTMSTGFNPFLSNASIWVEIDCGHFYRQRDTWENCSNYIDSMQRTFDRSVPIKHKAHYPNVPNLITEDWQTQYFGESNLVNLKKTKRIYDQSNVFCHSQSVISDSSDVAGSISTQVSANNLSHTSLKLSTVRFLQPFSRNYEDEYYAPEHSLFSTTQKYKANTCEKIYISSVDRSAFKGVLSLLVLISLTLSVIKCSMSLIQLFR